MKINKRGEIKPLLYSILLAFFILMILIVVIAKSNSAVVGKAFANKYTGYNFNLDSLVQADWFLYVFIALILVMIVGGIGYVINGEKKIKKAFKRERTLVEPNDFMELGTENSENTEKIDETSLLELKKYVSDTLAQGYNKDQMIDMLLQSGWQHDEIDVALNNDIK